MNSDNDNQAAKNCSLTLVPYADPAKLDREFLDLHGIPYPDDMPTRSKHPDSKPASDFTGDITI